MMHREQAAEWGHRHKSSFREVKNGLFVFTKQFWINDEIKFVFFLVFCVCAALWPLAYFMEFMEGLIGLTSPWTAFERSVLWNASVSLIIVWTILKYLLGAIPAVIFSIYHSVVRFSMFIYKKYWDRKIEKLNERKERARKQALGV